MTEREKFEAAVVAQQGKHGMLGDLRKDANGEYMSACERSAWWAWQLAAEVPYDAKAIQFAESVAKDAMRYHILRQHHRNDQPRHGIPFALAWDREDGKVTSETYRYMREGELDAVTFDVIFSDASKRAEYDTLFDKIYKRTSN